MSTFFYEAMIFKNNIVEKFKYDLLTGEEHTRKISIGITRQR